MTPNWNDAPEWAQWVAKDGGAGKLWWFDKRPALDPRFGGMWVPPMNGRCQVVSSNFLGQPICHPRPTTETDQ